MTRSCASVCDAGYDGRTCPITSTLCPGECVFADTLRNLQVGIVVLDSRRHRVLFCNAEAETILRPRLEPDDYQSLERLFTAREGIGPTSPRDTARLGARLLGFSVYNVVEGFIWVFIQDITDQARARSVAEAASMMEDIGFTFSGIRHELGNPVNSIKMTLSVLRNRLHQSTRESIEEYVDRCLDAVSRVEFLLQSLKSFNIYESLSIQLVELAPFLDGFKRLVECDLRANGIALRLGVGREVGAVRIDPRALQQVMLNLVANASAAVSGRPDPEILIEAARSERIVLMRVVDNGIGIAADELPNLFRPFYTTKEQGTGLGLVIARRMLTRMGGCIDVDSREGEGTIVTLTLPEHNGGGA